MIYVVGIGSGNEQNMTYACRRALDKADIIVGYTEYTKLIAPLYPNKRLFSTGMTEEVKRCRIALEFAANGETVAVICGGDAAVYGMAGLIYELSQNFQDIPIEVVSGVTAALAGSALLGAPLGHDFCVISLSDLLTSWEIIEKRLDRAAEADFCIVLYNPSSRKRKNNLKNACDVLLKHKPPETVCGIARNIGREGESSLIMMLADLRSYQADMFTTVFIGNAQTIVINGKAVTPRGYQFG